MVEGQEGSHGRASNPCRPVSVETKHSPELAAAFRARGLPEDTPVWRPSSQELADALELEAARLLKRAAEMRAKAP